MFLNVNKQTTSARPSLTIDNAPTPRASAVTSADETKRLGPQTTDLLLPPSHYGKTLNVPDGTGGGGGALQAPTNAAPITPPRPAIMTTPKLAQMKNVSTDLRPTLLVTTNKQQQPQTITAPTERRLPLSGRIATITSTKPRQETVVNEIPTKKPVINGPRPAIYNPNLGHVIVPNGNKPQNRQDSVESPSSTDDGRDNWSAAPRFVFNFFRFFF